MTDTKPHPDRILRLREVIRRIRLSRASIYRHMAEGAFPRPVVIGMRDCGWLESDIDAWLAGRIQANPKPDPLAVRPHDQQV